MEGVSERVAESKIKALCVPLSKHVEVQPLQPLSLLDWTCERSTVE